MYGIETDEDRARRAERRAIEQREAARRATLPIADRLDLWLSDPGGEEVEDLYDLMHLAIEELRRR